MCCSNDNDNPVLKSNIKSTIRCYHSNRHSKFQTNYSVANGWFLNPGIAVLHSNARSKQVYIYLNVRLLPCMQKIEAENSLNAETIMPLLKRHALASRWILGKSCPFFVRGGFFFLCHESTKAQRKKLQYIFYFS